MKRAVFATALASGVLLAVANPAWADQGHLATPTDPYLGCPFGGSPTSVNFPNTEPEPWLAHNPVVPDNLIGGTQQDRWSDGGGHGLVAPYSLDNGATWTVTPLPFSKCALPYYGPATLPYDRASDAWVDIGPDGTAYQISISFDAMDNNNAVGATVSVDQGRTYIKTQPIITDLDADPTFPFNDKESITADPRIAGTAYAVWDRLVLTACGPSGRSHNMPKADDRKWRGASKLAAPGTAASVIPAAALDCFEGPTMFAVTHDGGTTWSKPAPIVTNAPDEQTIANQIVVNKKTGRLYDFYTYFAADNRVTVEDIFSDDGGATWSTRQTVNDLNTVGIHDPKTGQGYRTGDIIPEPAIDPNTGQLYVVWQDNRYNSFDSSQDMIVISTSTTGLTGSWTNPILVNELEDHAAFTPAIKVNGLGQVAVDFYTFRQLSVGSKPGATDRYLRFSDGPIAIGANGQVSGTPFDSDETHIGGPFNMLAASWAGGFFTGDYEGMALDKDPRFVHDMFDQTNCLDFKCAAATLDSQYNPTGASGAPNPDDVFVDKFYRGS